MTAVPGITRATPLPRARRGSGWWIAAVLVLIPALVPPLSLAWQVLTGGAEFAVPSERLAELLLNTLVLAAAVTVTAISIGLATAWLTTRTDLPGRRAWMILAAMPLVVPSYLAALTIIGATGPGGVISSWLGLEIPTPYGFLGAWAALSVFLAPMAHLILVPALRQIDPATEEAATGLGSNRRRVFRTITLPQLRPALVSAGLMVGLYTVSDFGAVSLLRFDTFTRAIYTLYVGQIDRRPAATLSLVLMLVALIILLIERRARPRAGYEAASTQRTRRLVELRATTKAGSLCFLAIYLLLALVVPAIVLVSWIARGVGAGVELASFWEETLRTVGVAGAAALVAAVAAFPIAMVTTWRRNRWSPIAEGSVWAVYSLPHITVGVAVIAFALARLQGLYQTITLLILAYVAMFMAQAVSTIQDSLRRSTPDLEDASRGLGAGMVRTLRRVTIPISRQGLLAGAALVAISVMKELPATLLLRPNGFETLAIRIWSSTGEGFYTRASIAGLLLVAVSIVPLLVLTYRDLSD